MNLFNDFKYILNSNEYQWLIYYLRGYKQYEIAKKMNVSDTTIKNINLLPVSNFSNII